MQGGDDPPLFAFAKAREELSECVRRDHLEKTIMMQCGPAFYRRMYSNYCTSLPDNLPN